MNFVDSAKVYIKAGDGGSGCLAFRREKFVPKGGPSGGDGGKGGHIIAVADKSIQTLLDFRYKRHYKAKRGRHGEGDNKIGKSADNLFIRLPIGTVIKDIDSGEILADLVKDKQQVIIAKGGRGGRGNARFVSPTNRAPQEWEPGQEGEEKNIQLELKLLADVGFVGLPNAGKSTLLSRITAARPKIADYPFTTLVPQLGIVQAGQFETFVAADIPGLIQGAHLGKGLGIQFLKHIERTRVLAVLLDATSEDMEQDYTILLNELASFDKLLLEKPKLVIFTKADLLQDEFPDKPSFIDPNDEYILISSVRGDNIDIMKKKLFDLIKSEIE